MLSRGLPRRSPAIQDYRVATVVSVARARIGQLVVFVLAGSTALCGGCAVDAVVERASNEFTCPRERITVIEREDIATGLYDLDACGSRARYMCVKTDDPVVVEQCVHEPDPSRWDPDPALVASIPRPLGMSGDRRIARICPRNEPLEDDCLKLESGTWRWHRRASASGGGGLGSPGQ